MTTTTTKTASLGQLALTLTTPVTRKTASDDRLTRDERLGAARAVLARGLTGVRTDPAAMAAFLTFRSRFRDYSLNNTVLIWMQRPTARYCMGFKAWAQHGRRVRKGERGLTILAPILRKANAAEIAAGTNPDERAVVGFKTTTTFDYEQTEAVSADALVYTPPVPRLDAEAPEGLCHRLEAVAVSIGYTVRDTHLASYADGWCSTATRTITLQATITGADRAAVLCHELAHALAHDGNRETTRAQKELQAEGTAFVALSALDLDTSRASLPYLKSWAGDDDALAAELSAIDRIAADLLARIEATAA